MSVALMKLPETFRSRTLKLETVRFAFQKGYKSRAGNQTAIKHFTFAYHGLGAPDVKISWFKGSDQARVTVGDTSTDDQHALQILKKYW